MDDVELAKLQVEAWKTTIQVQQHFNDIELRIRALAITVLTAVIGAAALAIKDGTTITILGGRLHLGAFIFLIGLVAWLLFYLVDQYWYHRLLVGAVTHGEALEAIIASNNIAGFGLTAAISAASPYQPSLFGLSVGKPIHSKTKVAIFYYGVAVLLIAAVLSAQFGIPDSPNASVPLPSPSTSSESPEGQIADKPGGYR